MCIWGCVGVNTKTNLVHFNGNVNAMNYIDQTINTQVVPLFVNQPNLIYMHDNARPHTARITVNNFTRLGIPVLPWPAKSPDLNPIEHLWDELERRLRARPVLPTTLQKLSAALDQEWAAIPQDKIRKLIYSMRSRCLDVVSANGGHTRY